MPWAWLFVLTFHYGVSRGFFVPIVKHETSCPPGWQSPGSPPCSKWGAVTKMTQREAPGTRGRLLRLLLLWAPTMVERRFFFLAALNHCQTQYTALQNWKGGRHSGKSCRPDISRTWSQPLSTPDVLAHLQSCQTHSAIPHCQEMRKTGTESNLRDYGSSSLPPCAHSALTAARGSLAESVRSNPG